MSFMKIFKFN